MTTQADSSLMVWPPILIGHSETGLGWMARESR
jgi:hypothetical protein